MKVFVNDTNLEELLTTGHNQHYRKYSRNERFMIGLRRAVEIMKKIESSDELKGFSFLHYEKLKGRECSSVRIVNGMIERLIFTETSDGFEINLIEIDTTHYGTRK